MYTPASFPEPNEIRRSPDAGPAPRDPADGTYSVGRWLPKRWSEAVWIDSHGPGSDGAQKRPARAGRLRRALQPGTRNNPHPTRRPPGASGQSQANRSHHGEQRVFGQRDPGAAIFWEALDPVQRDAFRSVASSRTFAAGARLIAVPGWPEPASWTASIASTRTRSTARASASVHSSSGFGWLVTVTSGLSASGLRSGVSDSA